MNAIDSIPAADEGDKRTEPNGSMSSCDDRATSTLKFILCRYCSGRLVFEQKAIHKTNYIAVSHIWGDVKRQSVKGIDREVIASNEKVKFLEERLPSIMGDSWFWIDVLCVDQNDDSARVAVTQHVPTIFRLARKTLAIKESGGLRICCEEFRGLFYSFNLTLDEFSSRALDHYDDNPSHVPQYDGFLARLWPLEELSLSNNIEFIRCDPAEEPESTVIPASDLWSMAVSLLWVELWRFGHGWHLDFESYKDGIYPISHQFLVKDMMNEFVVAFIDDKTVCRKPQGEPIPEEIAIWSQSMFSPRHCAVARDYILAAFSRFPWYTLPASAKSMKFSELYVDCITQAQLWQQRGRAYLWQPLLTTGWQSLDDVLQKPVPATDIPTPKCLGEVLRLMMGPGYMNLSHGTKSDEFRSRMVGICEVERFQNFSELLEWAQHNIQFDVNCFRFSVRSNMILLAFPSQSNPTLSSEKPKQSSLAVLWTVLGRLLRIQEQTPFTQNRELEALMEMLKPLSAEISRDLFLLVAIISCGLNITSFSWVLRNMSLVVVDQKIFAFVPKSVMMIYHRGECEFRLLELKNVTLLLAHRLTMDIYSKCLFPVRLI